MIHEQLRDARVGHNLSRADLSKLSGVPRERIRQIENGANFTLETLLKLLPHLPGLKTISLGSSELKVGGVDAAALRDELAQWLEAGRRLLSLFEKVSVVTGNPPATAHADLEERIQRMESELANLRTAAQTVE